VNKVLNYTDCTN